MPKKYNLRFMHIADVHLGKNQYGLEQRGEDFASAFEWVCKKAVKEEVNFIIIAGDLFDKRSVNANTLQQAVFILQQMFEEDSSIEVFVIEGNHDRPYYKDKMGWIEYLSERYLVTHIPRGKSRLSCGGVEITNGEGEREGGFVGDHFCIGMLHAGVEGIIPNMGGCISKEDILKMKAFDYLALGHIHKVYEIDGWIFNPGSTEHWSISESGWDGGYYLVDVNTKTKSFNAKHVPTPKRGMTRIEKDISGLESVPTEDMDLPHGMNDWIIEITFIGEVKDKGLVDGFRDKLLEDNKNKFYLKIVDKTTRPGTILSEEITKDRTEIEKDVINELTGDKNLTELILELKEHIDDDPEDLLGVIEDEHN